MIAPDSPPVAADLLTQWQIDPVTLAVTLIVGVGYLRARRRGRAQGIAWPLRHDLFVAVGLAVAVWTSCGFLQVRSDQLMWVWTTQQLLLLLVIPVIVLAGQPVALLRRSAPDRSVTLRVLDSRPVRILGHPLVGPLLVPIIAALLFFGGLGAFALQSAAAGWAVHLLLLGVGALVALPLIDRDDSRSAMAVALALGVGMIELLLDAFPGAALTFDPHLTLSHFAIDHPAWAPPVLDDQHTAGAILWAVAEILDLPFLVLVTTRWMRKDAAEAAAIDADLDAQDAALAAALRPTGGGPAEATPAGSTAETARAATTGPGRHPAAPAMTAPWWLDDDQLRHRYRN